MIRKLNLQCTKIPKRPLGSKKKLKARILFPFFVQKIISTREMAAFRRFTTTLLADLKSRNLIHQITSDHLLAQHLSSKQVIYTGFDPTAKSLHVGNLFTIVSLLHFMASGHQIIALIGGATGHIGDPSGKADERQLLDRKVVSDNSKSITCQLDLLVANGREYLKRRGLETDHRDYKTLNNLEWFKNMSILDFLASAGRMSRVSSMVIQDH